LIKECLYIVANRLFFKKTYKGFQLAAQNLTANEILLNSINVLPVADRDTGANMALSMREVVENMGKCSSVKDLFLDASGTLLRTAKGNSGTILTLFFNGLANALEEGADTQDVASAVMAGAEKAYNGISEPMDGTILTVAIKAGEAGVKAARSETDMAKLVARMASAARRALSLTPLQNPVLSDMDVVDAGALGFCMILDGFEAAFKNKDKVARDYLELIKKRGSGEVNEFGETEEGSKLEYYYCTEFVIEKPACFNAEILKSQLNDLGDCIIPVADECNVKVHIHTDKPDAVFFIASLCGPLISTKIDNMLMQSIASTKDEQHIFLCRDQLTSDCIKSMGYTDVFMYSSGKSQEFKDYVDQLEAGGNFKLFTSVKISKELSDKFSSVTFFSDDEVFMNYLFSEDEI